MRPAVSKDFYSFSSYTMKYLFVLTVIYSCGLVWCSNEDFRVLDSLRPEDPCSRQGGICTIGADCPPGHLVGRGLCPTQRSHGVECCSAVSMKETRCRKHGGECMSDCNEILKYKGATDCPESTVCCVLVY